MTTLLSLNDPLWLRVWIWRNKGNTVEVLPPLDPEELSDAGLQQDPWPTPAHINRPKARIPVKVPRRDWVQVDGGSRDAEVFSSEDLFLRVATVNMTGEKVVRQAKLYEACGYPAPKVVASGENWMVTERVDGTHPTEPGEWVDSLAETVLGLRQKEKMRPLLTVLEPLTNSLENVLPSNLFRELHSIAKQVPLSQNISHGDLHTKNLFTKNNKIAGIIDFESAALAPLEKDTALWLTTLAGQTGIETVTQLLQSIGEPIDPMVLTGCLVHYLNEMATGALKRFDPQPYLLTVNYLAQQLAENPTQAADLIT